MFESFAQRFLQTGGLVVRLPMGRRLVLGDAENQASPLVVGLWDHAVAARVMRNPALHLGEAYMQGALAIEQGSLRDFMDLIGRNIALRPQRTPSLLSDLRRRTLNRLRQANRPAAAQRNVAHHYDLSLDLYRRFLDEDLQYSCAYFDRPRMTLEEAQAAKKRHVIAKLLLEPGQRVLDIGCGWGGMALTLAEAGVHATGVTLSEQQLATARERAARRGLSAAVNFDLQDYRELNGSFDRIVSIGMFEHVGLPNFDAYFQTIARLLTDRGVALVHAIGRGSGPGATQPWIAKYIFPGGYIPALSEVLPAIERAGLLVTDIEILRLHYAETLRHWQERFATNRAEVAALYDEQFCRMWEFYLAASEISFRHCNHMVFQIQLTKRLDAVPIVRDYMAASDGRQVVDPLAVASAA